jgi:3-oxoacyl-[acyl-carrier protein] reductase
MEQMHEVTDLPLYGMVAIVTGGGRGIGRAEALALARHGARIVVNDIGASQDGTGRDRAPAEAVVEEIRRHGGEAVAHFGDVADWEVGRDLVERALDRFGGLHIVVNNAGFSRPEPIFGMSEESVDAVVGVHLKAQFATTCYATAYWRQSAGSACAPVHGRIINTASLAGILGGVDQPGYAAAKAGVLALTASTAQACGAFGVTANAIVPRARTRVNEGSPISRRFPKPAEGHDMLGPENVSPIVVYLASAKSARVTGHVFLVWGRQVGVLAAPKPSFRFETEPPWTIETLDAQIGACLRDTALPSEEVFSTASETAQL